MSNHIPLERRKGSAIHSTHTITLKAVLSFRIVVFSNQRGIVTGKETKANLKLKFTSIMKRIGVPMMMFLSYGLGIYRKPSIGLWNLLEEENGELVFLVCRPSSELISPPLDELFRGMRIQ